MNFLTPMQLFVWIIGIVAASMLVIGLMCEWIFRIWFNCKKMYIADLAKALALTVEKVNEKMKDKAKKKEEKDKDLEQMIRDMINFNRTKAKPNNEEKEN